MKNRPPFGFISVAVSLLQTACAVAAERAKDSSKSAKTSNNATSTADGYAGYARTKIFGLVGQGTKFVYVFDRSGSMSEHGGKPLRAAKAELTASLKDLDERHQFYIVFYNEESRLFQAGPVKGQLVFAT